MPNRPVPLKAKQLVKAWEGFEAKAYQDVVGKWTIGYGWTLGVRPGMVWTQQQADENLEMRLQEYANAIVEELRPDTSDDQYAAFIVFAWNVGIKGALNSDAFRAHNSYKPGDVLKSLMSWTTVTIKGQKIRNYKGLVNRRNAEWQLYSAGKVVGP